MIFSLDKEQKTAIPLTKTTYTNLEIKEDNIEKLIAKTPCEFLDEDILIIGEQIDSWEETKERCDLLGLDKSGNLVIIEVKRDGDSNSDTTIQAVKYASYFSGYSIKDIVEEYQKYERKYQNNECSEEEIKTKIEEFIEKDDNFVGINSKQRIILIGKEFRKEVTSAVLWLRESDINIKCIEIIPYKDSLGNTFIKRQTLIPLKETEDFMVHRKQKEEENRTEEDLLGMKNFDNFLEDFNKKIYTNYPELKQQKTGTNHKTYYYWGKPRYHYELLVSKNKRFAEIAFHFEPRIETDEVEEFNKNFKNTLLDNDFEIRDVNSQKGYTCKIALPSRFSDLEDNEKTEAIETIYKKFSILYEATIDYVSENYFKD